MKYILSSILALMMGVTASVAQIPGMMSMPSAQPLEGTSLGANETISYDGIAPIMNMFKTPRLCRLYLQLTLTPDQ